MVHEQKAFHLVKQMPTCFQLKFTNGYILSMNIGPGGYNDNRLGIGGIGLVASSRALEVETDTAEVAVFDPEDNWVTKKFFPEADNGFYSIAGWQTMGQVETAIKAILEIPKRDRNGT